MNGQKKKGNREVSEWRWNLNLNASSHGRHHVGIQALPAREPEPAMLSKALTISTEQAAVKQVRLQRSATERGAALPPGLTPKLACLFSDVWVVNKD